MIFKPEESPDGKGPGHAILESGTPVALFYRKKLDTIACPDKIKKDLKKFMTRKNFFNLPAVISKYRRQARSEQALGNHLTLLWDNPERTIKKIHYTYQTQKG